MVDSRKVAVTDRSLPIAARFLLVALCILFSGTPPAAAEADALPSWNDGPAKQAITGFVARVTAASGPDFLASEQRVAVFDNDGTLWSEQPIYFQLAFVLERIRALAPKHPEWKTEEPFKSALAGDAKAALSGGMRSIGALMAATHAGMTTQEFEATVKSWAANSRHPKTGRLYTEMVYQPMIELLSYLRQNGFETYIVSGGGVEFMRPWAEKIYGIPPANVVGSSGKTRYRLRNGVPEIVKLPAIDFIDDGPGKPVGIQHAIGRRPVFAAGNSDGDLQMLQWTTMAPGPRIGLMVHHTDAEREWAYDRKSSIGTLDKALDEAPTRGWLIVDMKKDWKVVYPFQK